MDDASVDGKKAYAKPVWSCPKSAWLALYALGTTPEPNGVGWCVMNGGV